jgi:hypothetical protein
VTTESGTIAGLPSFSLLLAATVFSIKRSRNFRLFQETGRYLTRGVDMRAEEQCYDREVRRKLREISNKLTGL